MLPTTSSSSSTSSSRLRLRPQPRAPDLSGHCRISTASARCQWAAPYPNRKRQMSVGTAGPQRRAPELSGHCSGHCRRTSKASARAQWALPDLNRKRQMSVGTAGSQPQAPDVSGHCRTSKASARAQWALPGSVGTAARCHIECQVECQNIYRHAQDVTLLVARSNRSGLAYQAVCTHLLHAWWGSLEVK